MHFAYCLSVCSFLSHTPAAGGKFLCLNTSTGFCDITTNYFAYVICKTKTTSLQKDCGHVR